MLRSLVIEHARAVGEDLVRLDEEQVHDRTVTR
jgi:hypothetical protein